MIVKIMASKRFVILGMAEGHVVLFAAYTERAQRIRVISARRATQREQDDYFRHALELTQEEFAGRYHIPLGTLRDWEQGRSEPDQPTRAYLTLIARDPEHVHHTLNPKAG